MDEEVKDTTEEVIDDGQDPEEGGKEPDSPAGEGAKEDESPASTEEGEGDKEDKEKPPPYDQDPKWKAARQSEKQLNDLLEKHGFDSLEDLHEQLEEATSIKEVIGQKDLNEILEKAQRLEKYEEYWAEQEERRLQEEETPEETAERWKRKYDALKDEMGTKLTTLEQEQELRNQLQSYSNMITGEIKKVDIPKEYRPFLSKYLGVDNPFNEIDFTNKAEV